MKTNKLLMIIAGLLFLMAFQSCGNYGYIDEKSFLGTWDLEGRKIYSQMKIRIVRENGELKGYIVSPPDNDYGHIFLPENKPWITKIQRGANYYFKVTEQKVANELFAQYDLNPSSTFYATFTENKDTIFLSQQRPNKFIQKSDIFYKRAGAR